MAAKQKHLREALTSRRIKKKVKPGSPTGMMQIDPEASRTVVNLHCFDHEQIKEKTAITPLEAISFRGQKRVLWVRVDGLGDESILKQLRDSFGLHRLAMEDVINVGQRPKVERYGDVLFIVLSAATSTEHCNVEQVSVFLGKDFVLTFCEHPTPTFDPILRRMQERIGIIREQGCDYLTYAILDCIVDFYYPLLSSLGDQLNKIEEDILTARRSDAIQAVHRVKQDLSALHRTLFSIRDAMSQLPLAGQTLFAEETKPYLRDLLDHCNQLLEYTDNQRVLAADLMDIQFAFSANRMNEIMKVLTVIGAIFLPLGVIAGIYGMNFDPEASSYNMPELNWMYGYPFALGLMALVAASLLAYFWRRGWL